MKNEELGSYGTQKANGLVAVRRWRKAINTWVKSLSAHPVQPLPFQVVTSDNLPSDFQELFDTVSKRFKYDWNTEKIFARPAPVNPAHGFVDSIVVDSANQQRELWDSVKEADGGGELILTPYCQSTSNMVITPNCLSVGPGHDGATDGKDPLLLNYPSNSDNWWKLPEESGILPDSGKEPYVEVVQSRHNGCLLYTSPSPRD